MPEPETRTVTFSIRRRDIEEFAKVQMGIELMPHQLRMIDQLAQGKTMLLARRAGLNTAKRVLKEYIEQDSDYIKHFEKKHFRAITIDGKRFLYCPVGNICSWSDGDVKNKWCEWCKKYFDEIEGAKE